MKHACPMIVMMVAGLMAGISCGGSSGADAANGNLRILAWNNLGMHCYDPDFSDIAILPPYNTLWAQIVRTGSSPAIVTDGITVEYSFPDNTYSAVQPKDGSSAVSVGGR